MIALGLIVLPAVVGLLFVAAFARLSRRAGILAALVIALLLTAEWVLAADGVFHRWDAVPPPLMPVLLGVAALGVAIVWSPLGRRLIERTPLWALVGFQGFRLPLELVMHQAAVDGIMPVQMSFSGWNFDIVTGLSAAIVAAVLAADRAPSWLVVAWNALGSCLLLAIIVISAASTPTFAAFGQDHLNTWIADPPYVWLPGFLVPAALFGHVLLWRRGQTHRSVGQSLHRSIER